MSATTNLGRDIEKIAEMLEKNIPEDIILQLYPADLVEQVKAGAEKLKEQEQAEEEANYRVIEEVYARTALDDHYFIEVPESGKNPGTAGEKKGVWLGKYDGDIRIFIPDADINRPMGIPTEVLLANARMIAEEYETVTADAMGNLIVKSPYPDAYMGELPEGRIAVDQCVIGPELTVELYMEKEIHTIWITRGEKKICQGSWKNGKAEPRIAKLLNQEYLAKAIREGLLETNEKLVVKNNTFAIEKI